MENQTLSRFITYPSTVEKSNNHTVLLIDSTEDELAQLERFLKISVQNFDVYLYQGTTGDLEWLNHINQNIDYVLINDICEVKITPGGNRYQSNPVEYFEQYELDRQPENQV